MHVGGEPAPGLEKMRKEPQEQRASEEKIEVKTKLKRTKNFTEAQQKHGIVSKRCFMEPMCTWVC